MCKLLIMSLQPQLLCSCTLTDFLDMLEIAPETLHNHGLHAFNVLLFLSLHETFSFCQIKSSLHLTTLDAKSPLRCNLHDLITSVNNRDCYQATLCC